MIFDKNFDRSLWLMLSADKKNMEMIAGFISSIPNELFEQISMRINQLNDSKKNDDERISFLCGEYETSERILYWFQIDSYYNELEIGYKIFTGLKYEDVFKITLSSKDDLFNGSLFKDNFIGNIEYDIKEKNIDNIYNFVESSEKEYSLVRTPFGYFVVSSVDRDEITRYHISSVNVKGMPDELYLENLKNKNMVNQLVRRRKR